MKTMNTHVASKTTLLLSALTLCLTQLLTTPLVAVPIEDVIESENAGSSSLSSSHYSEDNLDDVSEITNEMEMDALPYQQITTAGLEYLIYV